MLHLSGESYLQSIIFLVMQNNALTVSKLFFHAWSALSNFIVSMIISHDRA